MNETNMSNSSKTNWERIDALTDDMIDTSDIPPLSESFFARAAWRKPQPPIAVTIHLDPDVLLWFKAQGLNTNNVSTPRFAFTPRLTKHTRLSKHADQPQVAGDGPTAAIIRASRSYPPRA